MADKMTQKRQDDQNFNKRIRRTVMLRDESVQTLIALASLTLSLFMHR
jgi:hypothetical protein